MLLLHKLKPIPESESEILEIQKVISEFTFKEKYVRVGGGNN
jgi:hypothetical protein